MKNFLPVNASAHGAEIDHLIWIVHWLMLALFVGWGFFFAYTLIRFRKSRSPKADYVGVRTHTSTYLEMGVAVVEAILLIGFSIPLWANRVNQFPSKKDALVVEVMAQQFLWNVHYAGPDGIFGKQDLQLVNPDNPFGLDRSDPNAKDDVVTINQLHLPVDRPVIINLSSRDVIHSFALQQMRVKQDTIPGQKIPVWFKPVKTTDQIRVEMGTTLQTMGQPVPLNSVAMKDYLEKDGKVIVKKMDPVNGEIIQKLAEAGIAEVEIGPATPTEIACAQLCGIGHYQMRGYMIVESQENFEKWLKDESVAASTEGAGGGSYD